MRGSAAIRIPEPMVFRKLMPANVIITVMALTFETFKVVATSSCLASIPVVIASASAMPLLSCCSECERSSISGWEGRSIVRLEHVKRDE